MSSERFGMRISDLYLMIGFVLLGGIPFSVPAQPLLKDSFTPWPAWLENGDSTLLKNIPASTTFTIGKIFIIGNKKTKPYIIQRELPFREGDSVNLPSLVKSFEIARQQLMNSTLFNEVIVSLKAFRGYEVDILIDVNERWYLFPVPYVKPVDRNLSEWAKQNFSAERVNYGFKLHYNNFTGRNDKLRIWFITGYTRQMQFQYEQPYADPTLRHGFKIGFLYAATREVNYATMGNEQQFTDTLGGLKRWYGYIDYLYRPGLRTFNTFRLAWTRERVEERLLQKNPNYYPDSAKEVSYPELLYKLNYYKVDYIPYPLTGWMGELSFLKKGVTKNMNVWQLGGKFTKSWNVWDKTWYAMQTIGAVRLPLDQPFVNQRMFGYQDMFLRGLENYVIDGVAGLLVRQTVRRSLLKFDLPTGIRSRSHAIIPFRFYAKVFTDMGYSYHTNKKLNSLTNTMMYTAGLGIDMVSFYDFVLRLDYSFNQFGENGVFLHIKSDF